MAKMNWAKTNRDKLRDTDRRNGDCVNVEAFKSIKTYNNDTHMCNIAKKCFDRMSKDPKNSNILPEDLWVKALIWAKSKLPDNSSNIIDNKT